MLLVIIGLLVIFLFVFSIYAKSAIYNIRQGYGTYTNKVWYKAAFKDMFPAAYIWMSMYLAVLSVFLFISYLSYVNARTFYDATMEQYTSAIEIYEDKAIMDVESAAWTDLKYQGYQESISKLIVDLRKRIVHYNEKIISKRIMKNNPVFSWLIIAPDADMKLIKMKTKEQ